MKSPVALTVLLVLLTTSAYSAAPRNKIESDIRSDDDGSRHRKRSRRRTDISNALAFVGYSQPSTVLKGGGGTPPTSDNHSSLSSLRRFAGVHVALCGHAVHRCVISLYIGVMVGQIPIKFVLMQIVLSLGLTIYPAPHYSHN